MRSFIAVAVAVAAAGCGPSEQGIAVGVFVERQLADGSPVDQLDPLRAVDVVAVADADRRFPAIEAATLLDVELRLLFDDSRVHVVIEDGIGDVHLTVPGAAAFELTQTTLSSAFLIDELGLVVGGFESRGLQFGEGTGITLESDGARSLPALTGCGSVNAIAVRFLADDSIVLASGETGTITSVGEPVVVRNADSRHIDTRCTDVDAGDMMSWTAARASLRRPR